MDWSHWWEVAYVSEEGHPVRFPHVVSYYGSWQRLRCWCLLEAYSFEALVDPRKLAPNEIFDPAWDRELKGMLLSWSVGSPRLLRLTEMLEVDEWLKNLYAFREWKQYGYVLLYNPEFTDWPAGKDLPLSGRTDYVNERIYAAARNLGEPFRNGDVFFERLRNLLELWKRAKDIHADDFCDAVRKDIHSATDWAAYLFGMRFDEINETVGESVAHERELSLAAALKPEWEVSQKNVLRGLPQFIPAFNELAGHVQISEEDVKRFLSYLTANGLHAWQLEFSALYSELTNPSDTTLDRRFLHLRSLANVLESLLLALAEDFGTEEDLKRVSSWQIKDSMKALLAGRRDWRAVLWECISTNWEWTQVSEGGLGSRLERLTDRSAPLCSTHQEFDGLARVILSQVAFRNFGSHRLTRDRELLDEYYPDLLRAVVLTAIFYWKVATKFDDKAAASAS